MNYLILDCDGVVSSEALRPPREQTGWHGAWTAARVAGLGIFWSHERIEAIRKLGERDDLTILWHTDWQADISEFSRVVRLPLYNYIMATEDETRTQHPWWKLPHVQNIYKLHPDSKIIWVDDNIKSDEEASEWVSGKENFRAISPYDQYGMTREHFEEIEMFLL